MLRVWLDAQQYLSAALRTVSYHKILSGDAFFMIMIFPASLHRLMLFNSLICFSIFERFETIRNILIVYFYTKVYHCKHFQQVWSILVGCTLFCFHYQIASIQFWIFTKFYHFHLKLHTIPCISHRNIHLGSTNAPHGFPRISTHVMCCAQQALFVLRLSAFKSRNAPHVNWIIWL